MIIFTLVPVMMLVVLAENSPTKPQDNRAGGWSMPSGMNPSTGQSDPGGKGAQPNDGGHASGTTATGTSHTKGASDVTTSQGAAPFKCLKDNQRLGASTKSACESAGGTWSKTARGATVTPHLNKQSSEAFRH